MTSSATHPNIDYVKAMRASSEEYYEAIELARKGIDPKTSKTPAGLPPIGNERGLGGKNNHYISVKDYPGNRKDRVLAMLADGHTEKEITSTLRINLKTISRIVSRENDGPSVLSNGNRARYNAPLWG